MLAGCTQGPRPAGAPPRDRQRAQELHDEGLALLGDGDSVAAETKLRQALDCDPFLGPAYSNLGVSLVRQGKAYDASWALRHAAALMPRASQPRMNLGVLLQELGRYEQAEEQLREALQLAPGDIEIVGQLALLHVRTNKRTSETAAWLAAIVEQDDHPAWKHWAQLELAKGLETP